MGNSPKPGRPDLRLVPPLPEDEPRELLKIVQAQIHGEIVGDTYIYSDNSFEIEVKDDISDEARLWLHEAQVEHGLVIRERGDIDGPS